MGLISSLLEKKKMPLVMGILNITPDSFYAKSRKESVFSALETALAMEQDGADIILFATPRTHASNPKEVAGALDKLMKRAGLYG